MNFTSDNAAGVSPQIMAALAAANQGHAMAYGADSVTKAAEAAFTELFERELAIFPVATGTAANALALSALTPPWGQTYCHRNAHIEEDEAGAPELFSGGAKLALLDGEHGKIAAETLTAAVATAGFGVQHHSQPSALSLTQATEAGTVYQPGEIAALAAIAHAAGLSVHMDGARFGNALAHLGCSPAEMTWKAGVDVLSFGATKNGAMAAEAVIFFNPDAADDFLYRRKRGGHLFSKMRLLSVQWDAYVTDDLWRRNAALANAMATRMADGLAAIEGCKITRPVQANIVFPQLPGNVIEGLKADGFLFYERGGERTIRLVCSFATTEQDVDAFIGAAKGHAGG